MRLPCVTGKPPRIFCESMPTGEQRSLGLRVMRVRIPPLALYWGKPPPEITTPVESWQWRCHHCLPGNPRSWHSLISPLDESVTVTYYARVKGIRHTCEAQTFARAGSSPASRTQFFLNGDWCNSATRPALDRETVTLCAGSNPASPAARAPQGRKAARRAGQGPPGDGHREHGRSRRSWVCDRPARYIITSVTPGRC